ncbi:hypothetical protein CHS0354_040136 [Potamilus streckersoni]|uniref:Mitochondrial ribosomal protein S18A n=1 Tax=Potamilus streckersoni TaxID=2493646 RepID=A0AAE0W0Z2_9BIVA|nr:hypothetical protein CHS0354_040136 [Potamilus streckersoni]
MSSPRVAFINRLINFFAVQNRQSRQNIISKRLIYTSPRLYLREVKEKTDGKVTTIEGVMLESPRKKHLVKLNKPPTSCTLCGLNVQYTDVLIINQFVGPDGSVLPREVTGLCKTKHYHMETLVYRARCAGLMPPAANEPNEEKELRSRYKWRQYYCYYPFYE